MRYYRFRVRTTEDAEDLLISAMQEIGLSGAQIEDHVPLSAAEKEQMFILEDAMLPPDPVADEEAHVAYVSFYMEAVPAAETKESGSGTNGAKEDASAASDAGVIAQTISAMKTVIGQLREHADIGDGTITADILDDADWINNWKQFFRKFYIDDILVLPSWQEMDNKDAENAAFVLHIDPGTAFGTGAHETTQLCVRALQQYVREGDTVLDVGTGSGVLSILALKFGAAFAAGTDLDPQVIPAVTDNLKANDIAKGRFHLLMGNLIDDVTVQEEALRLAKENGDHEDGYAVVVANILPVVLLPLTGVVKKFLKPDGIYLMSGILIEREAELLAALKAAGFHVLSTATQGEWMCIAAKPEEAAF